MSVNTKPKVLITRPDLPQKVIDKIRECCEVEVYGKERPIPKEDLMEMIKGKDGLLTLKPDNINRQVLEEAGPQLKVISSMSCATENIDMEACKEKNIEVFSTCLVEAPSVAEWTVALMICAGRNLVEAAQCIKKGLWNFAWSPTWLCGQGLRDSVVGIVGMGNIGQMVVKRLLPFGVKKILYFDRQPPKKTADELGCVSTPFEELLQNSDFVVSLVTYSESTKNMFNKEVFETMKKSAIFVNTSRGGVVDQKDLYHALRDGVIRGAAIDVTDPEPLPKDHELLTLDNCIVTPHVASAEVSVRLKMADFAADNLITGLKAKS